MPASLAKERSAMLGFAGVSFGCKAGVAEGGGMGKEEVSFTCRKRDCPLVSSS